VVQRITGRGSWALQPAADGSQVHFSKESGNIGRKNPQEAGMNEKSNDEIPAADGDSGAHGELVSDDLQSCPTCGEPITPSAPSGLCPKCAMAAVADDDAAGNTPTVALPKFEAPAIEEIAGAFPQLEILEVIGCGGMGAVYRARQPHLERMVALKILPKSLAETPEFTERFTREARTLAKLAHPNIVGIFDFGESGGYFYLLMEYVDGVNLRQAMRAGRFTPMQALEVVPEICNALQFAHDEGVLHRDIKPENILLDTRGRIRIADFGIAKLLDDTARSITLTQGMSPGTPQYMAPEQIEQPSTVDHRADIYSLGVVLYEMLTGELPIGRFAAPSEKTGVGAEIDEIVFRALEKDRARRQQSATEVRTDLADVPPLTDVPVPPTPVDRDAGVLHAKADPQNRPALALMLTVFSVAFPVMLFVFVLLSANGARVSEAQRSTSMKKVEAITAEALVQRTHEQKKILTTFAADHPKAEQVAREIGALTRQMNEPHDGRKVISRTNAVVGVMLQSAAAFLFVIVCFVPATVFAWQQLRRQRATGQREGRFQLLTAAGFWPLILLTCLVMGLFLFLLSGAPAWIQRGGMVLGLLVTIALAIVLIRRTTKWLNQPGSAAGHGARLEHGKDSPQVPAFKKRALTLVVLVGGVLGLVCLLVSLPFVEDPYFLVTLVPGVIAIVLLAVFGWLVNRTYRPGAAVVNSPGYNPWPKRVFWLVVGLFLAPQLLIGIVGLLMPALTSLSNRFEGDYAVGVNQVKPEDARASVLLQTRRKSEGVLKANVIFDGPAMPDARESSPDGTQNIFAGDRVTWTMNADTLDLRTLSFVFPNAKLAGEAYLQMNRLAGKSSRAAPLYADLQLLPLFELSNGDDQYRARVEFEFVPGS